MANKAHIIHLSERGFTSAIDDLQYLGTVPDDATRNTLPADVGDVVVVQNSISYGNEAAFYLWNGVAWELISSASLMTQITNLLGDVYTASEIDNLLDLIPILPPVNDIAARDAITAPNDGYVVTVRDSDGSGNPALFEWNGSAWVKIGDANWQDNLDNLAVQVTDLDTRLQDVEFWQGPVANLAALNAISSPQDKEIRVVNDDGFGQIGLYRYNSSTFTWQRFYTVATVTNIAALAALSPALISENVTNAIQFVSDEQAFFWFNQGTSDWVQIGGGTASIPILTEAERLALVLPPTGKLVYDTDAGDLFQYSGVTWIPFGARNAHFQKNEIPAGETLRVRSGERAIVFGNYTINGTLDVEAGGDFTVVTGSEGEIAIFDSEGIITNSPIKIEADGRLGLPVNALDPVVTNDGDIWITYDGVDTFLNVKTGGEINSVQMG